MRRYGDAQIYVDKNEYSWFRRFLAVRARGSPTNPYFFSGFGKGEARDLVLYMRSAWTEMGLPGKPNMVDMRSAVATCVSGADIDFNI